MRFVILVAVLVFGCSGVAMATTTSAFDATSDTLTVALTGATASTLVGCSTSTHDVQVGGADPGTGAVSCSAVTAISVTGDDGDDSISLAGISSTNFPSLTNVTADTGGGNDTYFASAIGDTVNMGAADNAGGDVVTPGSGNDHITCPGGCQVIENLTGATTLTDTGSSDPGGLGGVDSFSGVTSLEAETSGNNVNVDASGAMVPIVFDGYGNGASQVFRGGSGNDSFNISAGTASIDGGGGTNSLMISPGTDGKVTLTPTSLVASVSATLTHIQSASITGATGNNVYDWSTFPGPVVLSDISGDDTVTAGAGNDSITLFGGAGSVNAGGGDDDIYLSGNPTANYSVDGGSGANTLTWNQTAAGTTTATNSELTTPDGPISLANIGALTLLGYQDDDIFDARAFSGPVTVTGYGNHDVMLGGPAADSFTGGQHASDCFNGGPGADTINGAGSTSDTDVVDPADTLVPGSTYTPVSTCGYGDSAPTGSTTGGGSSGSGGGPGDSTPPAASAQIASWGTQFSPTSYGGSVTVIGFGTDPPPSSGTPTVRCSLDPSTVPTSYDDLGNGPCTQTTTTVGSHTFYVAARDPAGNTSTIASVTFQIVAVPDTTITSGPTGSTWSAVPAYTFASTIAGSTFLCSVDGAAATPCTSPRVIGPFAPGSTHTFSVRALSPAGVADPTPAVAAVAVNATQVSSRGCEITPFLATDPYDLSHPSACALYFARPVSCPPGFQCVYPPDTCPAAARCTLTTRATWTDADTNAPWMITVDSDVNGPAGNADGRYSHACTVADGQSGCAAHDTESLLGPASFSGFCGAVPFGGQFGPADDRDLVCTSTVTITPAQPLFSLPILGGIDIFAPASGTLVFAPTPTAKALRADRAHVKGTTPPVFRRTTTHVSRAGAVDFAPRLSARARAFLTRHHRLTLTLDVTFIPADGSPTLTRRLTTTLTVAAKRPPRCPTHPPTHHVSKRLVCLPAGAP